LAASKKKSENISTESVLGFEEALKELEGLVLAIERGDLSLDESLLAYQKGVGLARVCQERLAVAEQKVKVLEADLLKPFELDQGQAGQTGQTDD
jgi:exodeoxyribonuclease VII small subunit